MQYAVITVPAAAVRKTPNHRAEMVNQLLFGEAVKILSKKNNGWLNVESLYDGYSGWVTHHLVTPVDESMTRKKAVFLAGDLLNSISINGVSCHIPMGAVLLGFDGKQGKIAGLKYQYNGTVLSLQQPGVPKATLVEKYAASWLNAPYLWGGKTILGVDCSGFAQTIFKLAGIVIPRDAWQQAEKGRLIKKIENVRVGDLAFFYDKDEIVHVGILLTKDKIIHAAGKVRIDGFDKQGIIHCETGIRTHQLSVIKRFF